MITNKSKRTNSLLFSENICLVTAKLRRGVPHAKTKSRK